MEFGDTYFKVYRKLFDNSIWKHIVAFRLFLWILGNAVYNIEGVELGTLRVMRGQYLRSYRKLSEDLAYLENKQIKHHSISTIYRAVDKLVKLKIIGKLETGLGTLFTVINYDKYQPLRSNIKTFEPIQTDEKVERGTGLGTTAKRSENNTNKDKKVKKEERANLFAEKVYSNNGYPQEDLSAFIEYWTESGENQKKMRFEKEKVFDISIRMKTWMQNKEKWEGKKHMETYLDDF